LAPFYASVALFWMPPVIPMTYIGILSNSGHLGAQHDLNH